MKVSLSATMPVMKFELLAINARLNVGERRAAGTVSDVAIVEIVSLLNGTLRDGMMLVCNLINNMRSH